MAATGTVVVVVVVVTVMADRPVADTTMTDPAAAEAGTRTVVGVGTNCS